VDPALRIVDLAGRRREGKLKKIRSQNLHRTGLDTRHSPCPPPCCAPPPCCTLPPGGGEFYFMAAKPPKNIFASFPTKKIDPPLLDLPLGFSAKRGGTTGEGMVFTYPYFLIKLLILLEIKLLLPGTSSANPPHVYFWLWLERFFCKKNMFLRLGKSKRPNLIFCAANFHMECFSICSNRATCPLPRDTVMTPCNVSVNYIFKLLQVKFC